MLMIIEQLYVGRHNMLHLGTKSDRVILYHPKTYEEIVKEYTNFCPFIELLTDKEAHLSLTQLNAYKPFQL